MSFPPNYSDTAHYLSTEAVIARIDAALVIEHKHDEIDYLLRCRQYWINQLCEEAVFTAKK